MVTASTYGLERIRGRYLRRALFLMLLAAALATAAWLALLATTLEDETQIRLFGGDGNRVEIDVARTEPADRPVTVPISPGRVVRAPDPIETATDRPTPPPQQLLPPGGMEINPLFLLLNVALPFGIVALLARRGLWAARFRAKEINFGVYKGALPYELHASRGQTFRTETANAPLFVKVVEATRLESGRRA